MNAAFDPETGMVVELSSKRPEKKAPEPRLRPASLADVMDRVAAAGPRRWAIDGVWIEGSAMVVGAEEKAGKTVALADLAVSIASGTPWMNTLDVHARGSVLCFFAEDDDAEIVRRIGAICRDRGIDPRELPIRLCFLAPNLSDTESLIEVTKELATNPASVVILDPLYLAIGSDGDGASLYKMGDVLNRFKEVCSSVGAAPVVITHWNKGGSGTGRSRISGTGTTQWARTIVSISVKGTPDVAHVEHVVAGELVRQVRVTTQLQFEFSGNSIVPQTVVVRRRMWADDPSDLDSNLNYEVSRVSVAAEVADGEASPLTGVARAMAAVAAHKGRWVSAYDAQQWDSQRLPVTRTGETANPLKKDTVYRSLCDLEADGALVSRMDGKSKVFALPGTSVDAPVASVVF